jgi:hypothetical protein
MVQVTNSLMSTKQVKPTLKAGVYMVPVLPPKLQFAPSTNANEIEAQPPCLLSTNSVPNNGSIPSKTFPRDKLSWPSWVRSPSRSVEKLSDQPMTWSTLTAQSSLVSMRPLMFHRNLNCSTALLVNVRADVVGSGSLPQLLDDILEDAEVTAELQHKVDNLLRNGAPLTLFSLSVGCEILP